MAVQSTIDTIQRLRLEAHAILDALGGGSGFSSVAQCDLKMKAQLTRLHDISAELRRIAVKAATPEAKRDAESLAALIDKARSPQMGKPV
jgi:hypothetical protein